MPGFRSHVRWYEHWQSPEARLATLETELQRLGAKVRRGGDFDRWDLDVRRGVLGGTKLLMAIEEHGSGKQLVRLRLTPQPSRFAKVTLGLAMLLLIGTAFATSDPWIEGFAATVLLVVCAAIVLECAGAEAMVVAADEATVQASD